MNVRLRLACVGLAAALCLSGCQPTPPSAALGPNAAPSSAVTAANDGAPDLSSYGWDDRAPFRAGLVASQQAVLNALPGAPVYHIAITLTASLDALTGHEVVRYTNQTGTPLDQIVFHLFPNLLAGSLAVHNVEVNSAGTTTTLDQRGTILRVPLRATLPANGHADIAMDFEVSVPHDLQRNYGVFVFNQNILALSHFFPLVAAYDQRGWNVEIPAPIGDLTYAEAAFYLVQLRAPARPVVAGSGSLINRQATEGEQVLTFAAGPARDFYLSLSPDYIVISEQAGEVTLNSYAPAGHEVEARSALEAAKAALADYGARYGPYPYTELDVVATSTTALGIEYPGIIAITLRVYDPNANFGGTPVTIMRESTVAHEVGHQWFYNLVGDDQLGEPWLDESLTQYITWQYYAHQYGTGGDQGFRASLEGRWKTADKPDMPIGLPVSAYTSSDYGAIIYGRGPLFFEALAQQLGPANMDTFLADYVRQYQWKIATGAGLKTLAEQHCGCDLSPLWQQWINP